VRDQNHLKGHQVKEKKKSAPPIGAVSAQDTLSENNPNLLVDEINMMREGKVDQRVIGGESKSEKDR